MIKKSEIQTFNTQKDFIISPDNQTIKIPNFVRKSYKRYRYNESDTTLEKQCAECQKWYAVLKVVDGVLSDCHQESDYHYMGDKSGYGSYCKKCSAPKVIPKSKQEDLVKYSVFLTKDNIKYMSMRCAAQDISKTDFLNMLISEEKHKNPITKYV